MSLPVGVPYRQVFSRNESPVKVAIQHIKDSFLASEALIICMIDGIG